MGVAARAAVAATVAGGVAAWERERMLPRLIAVSPEDLADGSRETGRTILRRLLLALRGERRRGRAGHWSYDLDRHIGLVQAVAAERARLAGLGPAPRIGAARIAGLGEAADGTTDGVDRR